MDFFSSTDIKSIIANLFFGFVGFLSSLAVEHYKKKKPPKTNDEILSQINLAASENIKTAQDLLDAVEDIRRRENEYFKEQIERSKLECQRSIEEVRLGYISIINAKIAETERVYDEKIEKIRELALKEKGEFLQKIESLERDKVNLQDQVEKLTERLRKYEHENGQHS
jgi:hypothetical protein